VPPDVFVCGLSLLAAIAIGGTLRALDGRPIATWSFLALEWAGVAGLAAWVLW